MASLSIVLSLFIHKISSKHDRDHNMLLTFITSITFCEDVRFRFWTLFDTQLINFIRKYF